MAEVQFCVDTTSLDVVRNAEITANFSETKAALSQMLAPYKSLIVTPETISEAKQDRAKINRLKKQIDDTRKAVKTAYTEKLKPFEEQCKELTGECDEAILNLDGQVKAFEERKANEKIDGLRAYFSEHVDDMAPYLTFENVFNPRWANKGFEESDAQAEITRAIAMCRVNVGAIVALRSEFEAELLENYRENHDLPAVIARNNRLTELKRVRDAEKERQELLRKDAEARQQAVMPAAQKSFTYEEFAPKEDETLTLTVLDFRVWVTESQKAALKAFLKENNIKFGRVPTDGN